MVFGRYGQQKLRVVESLARERHHEHVRTHVHAMRLDKRVQVLHKLAMELNIATTVRLRPPPPSEPAPLPHALGPINDPIATPGPTVTRLPTELLHRAAPA